MAVTTTYQTALLGTTQRVNVTTASDQWNPQAIVTASGSVVFYADSSVAGGRILARSLDANGVPTGGETVVATGVDASFQRGFDVVKLTNGNIAVAWSDSTAAVNLHFRVFDSAMNQVVADTIAENTSSLSRHPDLAATAAGGFVLAWEKDWGVGDHDIAFRRFNDAGGSTDDSTGLLVDAAGEKVYPSVAVLTDGKIAFAYHEVSGANTIAWHAIMNADGTVAKAAAPFDATGSTNQKAEVVARPDGGYTITYEDNGWAGDRDITAARFNSAGTFQNYVRASTVAGSNEMASAAVSVDGYTLVSNVDGSGNYDSLAALISPTGTRLFVDDLLRGDGVGGNVNGYGSVQWLDASRILLTDITSSGSTGGDASGYAVSATVRQVQRTTIGDGSSDTITLNTDGLRNIVDAGGGADVVTTGAAVDLVNGGAGDDIISVGGGADTVHGGADNDTINGGDGADALFGDAGLDTIYGGAGDDYIEDTSGASSVLVGEAGADTIYGGLGNDYMVGGDGADTMVGGGGQDSMYGGAGADYMVAGNGVGSVVDGGAGANTLWGANGADYIVGGEGGDLIVGGAGSDYEFGNAGADTLYGGQGTDYIYTNAGDDFVWTDDVGQPQSTDYVYVGGGTGVDTVADFLAGSGANHDVLVVSPASGVSNFAQAQANMTQVGVYTVLNLGADQVYLYNVQPFQLTADNFLFI